MQVCGENLLAVVHTPARLWLKPAANRQPRCCLAAAGSVQKLPCCMPTVKDPAAAHAGPPPMMNAISGDKAKDKSQGELTGILKQLGYTPEQVFKF